MQHSASSVHSSLFMYCILSYSIYRNALQTFRKEVHSNEADSRVNHLQMSCEETYMRMRALRNLRKIFIIKTSVQLRCLSYRVRTKLQLMNVRLAITSVIHAKCINRSSEQQKRMWSIFSNFGFTPGETVVMYGAAFYTLL